MPVEADGTARPEPRHHLVRHGWADWGAVRRGDLRLPSDLVPLTAAGRERVRATAERLRPWRPALVVSSPVARALESAHLLARALDLPLTVEPDLREWTPATVRAGDRVTAPGPSPDGPGTFRAALAEMLAANGEWPPGTRPGWEPLSAVRRRVKHVLARYEGVEAVVVTHGVVLHALTGHDVPPGGIVRLTGRDLEATGPPRPSVSGSGPVVGAGELDLLRAAPGHAPRWDQLALARVVSGRVDVPRLDAAIRRRVDLDPLLRRRYLREDAGGGCGWEVLEHGEIATWVVEESSAPTAADWIAEDVRDRLAALEWPLLRVTVVRGPPDTLCLVGHGLVTSTGALRRLGAELAGLPGVVRPYAGAAGSATRPAAPPADPPGPPPETPPWAADRAHRYGEILDRTRARALLERYGQGGAELLDLVLAALSWVRPREDAGVGVAVLVHGGPDSGPGEPGAGASLARSGQLLVPPDTAPGTVLAPRAGRPAQPPPGGPAGRYVVDFEASPDPVPPGGGTEPVLAAWRCSLPVLAFEERGGSLHGWQPVDDDPASPHHEVARLLRAWAGPRTA
ncbi:histidine phosphatase family protein [Streptomyces anulatus]|uniref:histidine phosphatase family protein n=1 Tax=Streptomyces anulatus TaxID=1892 RepID=UPI001C27B190|nr:histidine phosphatase family protein [Streptomyces anulatus]